MAIFLVLLCVLQILVEAVHCTVLCIYIQLFIVLQILQIRLDDKYCVLQVLLDDIHCVLQVLLDDINCVQ